MFTTPTFLLFASDAELAAIAGALILALSAVALLMDRRRLKRARIEKVGWMPWTGLFLALTVIGGGLLAMSLPTVIAG